MYVLLLASMLFVNVSTYSLMIIQLFATPRLLQTSRRRSGEGQTVRPPTFFSSRPSNFFGGSFLVSHEFILLYAYYILYAYYLV